MSSNNRKKAYRYFRYLRIPIYFILLLYVFVVWVNIPFPVLNQQTPPAPYYWSFTYPPSPAGKIGGYFGDTIFLQTKIEASQPIADGVAVNISGVGSIGVYIGSEIQTITVGFVGAYPHPAYGFNLGSFAGIRLNQTPVQPNPPPLITLDPSNYLVGNSASIIFRRPGDYPLTIELIRNNGSFFQHSYDALVIHVQSSTDIRQGRLNEGIGAATLVGFLFVAADILPRLKQKPSQSP